jgi:toxin-antitoxin system PIN domain toxin
VQLVDANVLLYAVNAESAHHLAARGWLDRALVGQEPVGFAWVVLLAFLRLATRTGVFSRPLGADDALNVVELWLEQPAATVVEPTPRHAALLRGLLDEVGVGGNLVNDAHLAALALEHGAEIVSFDRDFGRFAGVRARQPAV